MPTSQPIRELAREQRAVGRDIDAERRRRVDLLDELGEPAKQERLAAAERDLEHAPRRSVAAQRHDRATSPVRG